VNPTLGRMNGIEESEPRSLPAGLSADRQVGKFRLRFSAWGRKTTLKMT
jgi:hypothetical protein